MRISTRQTFLNSISNMQNSQTKLADLQNQLSTGKRLNKPSDDPVAAAQVVKLNRELAQTEKYQENIDVTQRRLELEETILDDINTAMDRLRELTIQAGNGILNDYDRKGIATELRGMTDYLAGLMNTQDAQGEYLFAGSKGFVQPYQKDALGSFNYHGDDGQRLIQVAPTLFVPSNDSGQYLFEAATDQLNIRMTGETVAAGTPFITMPPATATYENAFEDEEQEQIFVNATQGLGDITVTVSQGVPWAYTLTDSGGSVLTSGTFADGDTIEFNGLKFDLAEPVLTPPATSSITLVAQRERENVLDVALALADVLEQPVSDVASREALGEIVATSLNKFEMVQERNVEARTAIGARVNALENTRTANEDFNLFTKTALSSLEDVDFAEAISELQLEEAILQAAQASFVRISELSLFNYLR